MGMHFILFMKKLLFILSVAFSLNAAFGQQIHYEKSFHLALSKAANQNKLVFVLINPPKLPAGYSTGLDDQAVITKYNTSFINYRVLITDTAVNQFRRKYQMNIYPAYFFFDKNNNLIHRDDKNASTGKKYIDMAEAALMQISTGKTLSYYDAEYKKGKLTASFLKDYIAKREQLGVFDNAELVDQYVDFLPVNSLKDYQTILFLLKAGPYAYGKTYTLAYTNKLIADSIYKTEPIADRIAINNRIINNTLKEAINKKNAALAQQASTYLRSTYGNSRDYRSPHVNSTKLLLQYYTAVKDTANYLRQAVYLYDNFYMNISADSAKKLETAQRNTQFNILNNGKKVTFIDSSKKPDVKIISKDTVIVRQAFFTTTPVNDIANELNNAAYSFYTTGTVNPAYLTKAIIWSRRSILFNPVFAYYDTLAHLLYRYGFYAEAEVNQNMAVNLAKKTSTKDQAERMEEELKKIKKRTL